MSKYNRAVRMAAINEANEAILEVQMMAEEMDSIFAEIEEALSDVAENVRHFVHVADKYMRKMKDVVLNVRIPAGTFARPVACPQCYSHAFYRRRR